MTEGKAAAPLAILACVVAWCGILLQLCLTLALSIASGRTIAHGVTVFFGYFTILTNLLVAIVLTVPLMATGSAAARLLDRPGVRTATAAAIALVGIAYHLLLRNAWDPEGWQFAADAVLHYVTPALYLVYWWVAVPKQGLRGSHVALWACYPLAYLVYVLLRGHLTGWYAYHFLDVDALGYGRTIANAVGVLLAYLFVAMCLLAGARFQRSDTLRREQR